MRIQHNIPAMNSYRNYTTNNSALNKNLEKLSSGYKINRAGDDAAGLAISEKMRAQISGLEQAQKNAKSGISLIQTAEGALQEVHDMLNRMYTLAEQSANGTYDNDVDRVQLNEELQQLKDEINRINDTANFNGQALFNKSSVAASDLTGAKVTLKTGDIDTTNSSISITDGTATYTFNDISEDDLEALNDLLNTAGGEITLEMDDDGNFQLPDTLSKKYVAVTTKDDGLLTNTSNDDEVSSAGSGAAYTVEIYAKDAVSSDGTPIDGKKPLMTFNFTATIDSTSENAAKVTFKNLPTSTKEAAAAVKEQKKADKANETNQTPPADDENNDNTVTYGGTGRLTNNGIFASGAALAEDAVSWNSADDDDAVADPFFTAQGTTAISVRLTYASSSGISASATVVNGYTAKAAVANSKLTVTVNKSDGSAVGTIEVNLPNVKSDATSSASASISITLSKTGGSTPSQEPEQVQENPPAEGEGSEGAVVNNSDGLIATNVGHSIDRSGDPIKVTNDDTGDVKEFKANYSIEERGDLVKNNGEKKFSFAIGEISSAYSDGNGYMNILDISYGDVDTTSLNINDIDITTAENAQVSLDKIKSAIDQVSGIRGRLGAYQNRLEHTINNLGVMRENISDAESVIRDTDVAEEMMAYTKNSILNQSAQAMLAQANQLPQGVLQLLG